MTAQCNAARDPLWLEENFLRSGAHACLIQEACLQAATFVNFKLANTSKKWETLTGCEACEFELDVKSAVRLHSGECFCERFGMKTLWRCPIKLILLKSMISISKVRKMIAANPRSLCTSISSCWNIVECLKNIVVYRESDDKGIMGHSHMDLSNKIIKTKQNQQPHAHTPTHIHSFTLFVHAILVPIFNLQSRLILPYLGCWVDCQILGETSWRRLASAMERSRWPWRHRVAQLLRSPCPSCLQRLWLRQCTLIGLRLTSRTTQSIGSWIPRTLVPQARTADVLSKAAPSPTPKQLLKNSRKHVYIYINKFSNKITQNHKTVINCIWKHWTR